MRIDEAINILRPDPPSMDGLKKSYRRKSLEYHPDRNPHGLEMMKLINLAYEVLVEHPNFWMSDVSHDYSRFTERPLDEEMQRIIDKVKRWPDVEIEIIGSWLWIKTRPTDLRFSVRFSFLGLGYSKKRQAWYWHPPDFEFSDHKSEMSMNDMRRAFGSRKIKNEPWRQI